MSRSNYSSDIDEWALIRWRGQVASATRGKRGQQFLLDLFHALAAMPEKRLISGDLENIETGEVCAIGALGKVRGVDLQKIDPEDSWQVANEFNIAHQLAAEVAFVNDEEFQWANESPEQRYERMVKWVLSQIKLKAESK